MDKSYNGWTNWETWNYMLWINNNEKLHNLVMSNYKTLVNREFREKWLVGVAENCVGTELMSDLKKSDIKNINFEEIIDHINDHLNLIPERG